MTPAMTPARDAPQPLPQRTPPPAPPENRAARHREINLRRAQLENPELLRALRGL